MIYLGLSIICSAFLILFFKVFERHAVPVFQGIVFNYWSAAICGFIFLPANSHVISSAAGVNPWLFLSVFLGMLFLNVFNLTGLVTLRFGVSTSSVAYKLGLVFPVILAFACYHEGLNWLKGAGICLALVAVVLSSIKESAPAGHSAVKGLAFLPYLLFIGSGACDSFTQFANKRYLMTGGINEFVAIVFLSAAVTGTVILLWQLYRGTSKLVWKSLVGGIALGIPNYLAFIFILRALATLSWGSSVIFPVNNLGTVAVASIVGFIVFKEKISKVNLLGLAFAAVSIVCIILSNY